MIHRRLAAIKKRQTGAREWRHGLWHGISVALLFLSLVVFNPPKATAQLPPDASHLPDNEPEEEPGPSAIVIPPLPTWGTDEPKLVPRLWPGNDPVPGTTRPIPFEAEIQLPPEIDPTVIPELHLPEYFGAIPETYLVDPQTLLTGDQRTSINLALKRHVNEHKIPVYVLLFQKDQRVPEFQNLDGLQKRWFGDTHGVVVGFWLGSPTRTSCHFGNSLRESYGRQLDEAFANALGQAYTKTYPFSQLDHFSYTLLWRLSQLKDDPSASPEPSPILTDPLAVPELPEISKSTWLPIAAKGSALAICVAAIGTGILVSMRKRERTQNQPAPFILTAAPPAERLAAPHSGGSGAIVRVSEPPTKIPS